jgi:hypothetical protein
LTVIGPKLNRSEIAPDFTLDHFDGQAVRRVLHHLRASQGVTLTDSDGSIRILNVMNSLDTPICDIETRRWEQRAVFALDADRRLVHVECVDDQMQEPDYQAAVDAVRSVATSLAAGSSSVATQSADGGAPGLAASAILSRVDRARALKVQRHILRICM